MTPSPSPATPGFPLRGKIRAATHLLRLAPGRSGVAAVAGIAMWRVAGLLGARGRPRALRTVRLPGFTGRMHLYSDELAAYYAIAVERLYESVPGFAVRPDWVVVEGGAHVGFWTVTAARRLDPALGGRLFAFEPSADACALLRVNVAANGVGAAVEVSRAALFARDGAGSLVETRDSQLAHLAGHGSAHISATGRRGRTVPAETVRLDTVVRRAGINRLDLIKLNVEGAEVEALDGAAEVALPLARRVVVAIEAPGALDQVRRRLAAAGLAERGHAGTVRFFSRDGSGPP